MPNGGSDNCSECQFLERLTYNGHEPKEDQARGLCRIRRLLINDPAYTYCENAISQAKEPDGAVYVAVPGAYPPERRLWPGTQEACRHVEGRCVVCRIVKPAPIELLSQEGVSTGSSGRWVDDVVEGDLAC